MDISKCGIHSSEILIFLLREGESSITSFSKLGISTTSYYRTIRNLDEAGFLKKREIIKRRKIVYVSLTEKGRRMAEQLRGAEDIEKGVTPSDKVYDMPPEFGKDFKNQSAMVHFNVKDDHIAISEHNFDSAGNDRVVFVYTKLNGHNVMRLFCDTDKSWDCKHTQFAWTLPDVQELVEKMYAERHKE